MTTILNLKVHALTTSVIPMQIGIQMVKLTSRSETTTILFAARAGFWLDTDLRRYDDGEFKLKIAGAMGRKSRNKLRFYTKNHLFV